MPGSLRNGPTPTISTEKSAPAVLNKERVLDWAIADLQGWAKKGDTLAGAELHRYLARALREDVLTPLARETLARMHEQIAQGTKASEAMLTRSVSNRAPTHLRNRIIANQVVGMIALYDHWSSTGVIDKVPTRQEIFADRL